MGGWLGPRLRSDAEGIGGSVDTEGGEETGGLAGPEVRGGGFVRSELLHAAMRKTKAKARIHHGRRTDALPPCLMASIIWRCVAIARAWGEGPRA
jgi:hypothetical protein